MFFRYTSPIKKVSKRSADIAWFIYDLELVSDGGTNRFQLVKIDVIYTEFESALLAITTATLGKMEDFIRLLQDKLDEHLETPPNNNSLDKPF